MSANEKVSVSLPNQIADTETHIGSNELVRSDSSSLQESDLPVDRWLKGDVAVVYDAMQDDPGRGLTADSVFDDLRARHAVEARGKY